MEALLPEACYHIFNHANGDELIFREDENYRFFIAKYKRFVAPLVDTLAYCLMPNHFHLMIRLHDINALEKHLGNSSLLERNYLKLRDDAGREELLSKFVSKRLSNFFSSYTQSYNKMYGRMGSLFMKNFKRKRVADEKYFLQLIKYIHLNPVTHAFVGKPEKWVHSSYNSIISDAKTIVDRDLVINSFGGLDNFKYCHLSSEALGNYPVFFDR